MAGLDPATERPSVHAANDLSPTAQFQIAHTGSLGSQTLAHGVGGSSPPMEKLGWHASGMESVGNFIFGPE
jgi:hypothetical protein